MFRFSIRQFGYNGDGTVSAKYQLYLQTSLNQFIPIKLCNTLDEAKTGAEDFINATLAAGIGWVDATLASGSTVFVPFNEGDEPEEGPVNPSSIIESMTFTPSGTITGPGRSVTLRIVFKDDMILSNPDNMFVTFTMDNENIEDYFYYSDHGEVEPAGADYIDFVFVTYNTTEYNFPFELVSLSLSGASLSLGGVAQPSTITDFSNYTSPTMNITPIVFVGAVFDSLATVTAGNPNMTVVITLPKAIQAVANPQNINLQFSGTNGNQGFLNYSSFSGSQMTFTRTIPNGNSDTTAEDFTFGSITPFSTGKITFVDGDFVDSTGEIAPQAGLLYDAPTIAY